jgi:hypothetical protein
MAIAAVVAAPELPEVISPAAAGSSAAAAYSGDSISGRGSSSSAQRAAVDMIATPNSGL